jgi:hypothetical protein
MNNVKILVMKRRGEAEKVPKSAKKLRLCRHSLEVAAGKSTFLLRALLSEINKFPWKAE